MELREQHLVSTDHKKGKSEQFGTGQSVTMHVYNTKEPLT